MVGKSKYRITTCDVHIQSVIDYEPDVASRLRFRNDFGVEPIALEDKNGCYDGDNCKLTSSQRDTHHFSLL